MSTDVLKQTKDFAEAVSQYIHCTVFPFQCVIMTLMDGIDIRCAIDFSCSPDCILCAKYTRIRTSSSKYHISNKISYTKY